MLKVTSSATQTTRLGGRVDEKTSMFGPLTEVIGTWVGNKGTFLQLQYSQTTILEFIPQFHEPSKLIQWPHVNINTMIKQ